MELGSKMKEALSGERSGEKVHRLVVTGDVVDLEFPSGHPFSDKVEVYFHVLCASVEYRVGSEVRRANVITPNDEG